MTGRRRTPPDATELIAVRRHMVAHDLVGRGVRDPRLLDAMAEVPRHAFVPENFQHEAYADRPLPIGEGQTNSQPYVVALMIEALAVAPGDRVLEVGAGSGYALAVLARLARHAVGVERIEALTERAAATLAALGVSNAEVHTGDGTLGWEAGAPYDAILVSAGGTEVPTALVDQLAAGGRLIIPVGRHRTDQRLVLVRRTDDGLDETDLGAVAFVPLIGEQGW